MKENKEKIDIILKVPNGNYCLGCMFLNLNHYHNYAECFLFKDRLNYSFKYGDIDESTIEKCDRCPKE